MSIMGHRTPKKSTRRRFLSQVGRAGLLAYPLVGGARSLLAQTPTAPTNLRLASSSAGARAVLGQNDFSYLGCFLMPTSAGGGDAVWGKGLTHRYVNGQLSFLASAWNPQSVYEVTPPPLVADPSSAGVASVMRTWGTVAAGDLNPIGGNLFGLYWDSIDQRLYWTGGNIYNTTGPLNPSVGYATLNDSAGAFAPGGIWSLTNYSCKMAMGGVTPIPKWFSDQNCPGARLGAGFGGYFSIATIGPVSMGPALTAFDPSLLASTASGAPVANTPLVNYPFVTAAYGPPDRCHRDTDYTTEFDGWNPQNSIGYWSWTDTIWQSAVWIDTPSKTGLVYFPTFGNGRTWYENSDLHAERGSHAWLVYDPADLASVAKGAVKSWQIQPTNVWQVQYPFSPYPVAGWSGEPWRMVVGASFDQSTNRLYICVRFNVSVGGSTPQVVYAYQVS
jgi:hypothetical protein